MRLKLDYPGFWRAVLLVLLVLGFQFGFGLGVSIVESIYAHLLNQPDPQMVKEPLVIGLINLVGFGVAIGVGLDRNRLAFKRAFPAGQISVLPVLATLLLVLGAIFLLSEVDNVFRTLFPPPASMAKAMKEMFQSHEKLLSRICLMVIIAPVTEELFFRGIILRGLFGRFRPWTAITLTAVLFAALHANPWQFLSAFSLGLAFGWFYLRTGSIWLCVLAHATGNALNVICTLLPWDIPGFTVGPDSSIVRFQPWWLDLLGLGLFLAGIWTFRKATPRADELLQPEPPPPLPPELPPEPGCQISTMEGNSFPPS